MPIHIEGDLAANKIHIDKDYLEQSNGIVILRGTGIVVSINSSRPSNHVRLDLDDNSSFEMEPNSFVNDLHVHLRGGSQARIGENTFGIGSAKLFSHEKAEILIGKNCLLGGGLECLTSDMHSILDAESEKRINPPSSIFIDDNVWLGAQVILLKGSRIGAGSIVGIRSTVMGEFPPNCVILGFPARVVKTGVTWSRDLRPIGNA